MKAWKGESIKFPALPVSFPTTVLITFILYEGLKGQKAKIYTHANKKKKSQYEI